MISINYFMITYIIDHANTSVRITTYLFTLLLLCVLIVNMSGGTCSLNSSPYNRFLRNFFVAILSYSQNLSQKSAWRKLPKTSHVVRDL